MSDWLSFVLLGSGLMGLFGIYFVNRRSHRKHNYKTTSLLDEKMTQVLYFNTPIDSLVKDASEFSSTQLIRYFAGLFSQYRTQESISATLCELFQSMKISEKAIHEYHQASFYRKLDCLDGMKGLPVPEITQFLFSLLTIPNPYLITIKAGEALAAHQSLESLPVFLKHTIQVPSAFNDKIAEAIIAYQVQFPDYILDNQNSLYYDFACKIETRYASMLDSSDTKIVTAGLYVLGLLRIERSIASILQTLQKPNGRDYVHIGCTALKKFSYHPFLFNLYEWIFANENWSYDEMQDLLLVFLHFDPTGEEFVRKIASHPQLLVQVSAKAILP